LSEQQKIWKVITASSAGTMIEWYDFYIFGSLASILAVQFFEKSHPVAAFLSTVALFSIGFLIRPLGALLAVWPFRHRGTWGGYLPGVYLAALGELGQPFIAARYFDVTDILVGAAGLGIGWAVLRRAGFSPYGEMLTAPAPTRASG